MEGLADSTNENAALIDCGCSAICFGCPYKINWIQTGRSLIGRHCTCTCNCPPNPFFSNPIKPTPSTSQIPVTPSIPQVPTIPSTPTPQIPSTPSTPHVPNTPSTPIPQIPNTPSTPHVPNTPFTPTPQIPTTPSIPQAPRAPSVPSTMSPTCAVASVNIGLCWARASVGTAFHNDQLAAGCCNMFTEWGEGCFGGDNEIPRIVSYWVPPALVQYCATHH
ncbi:hypothetical protein MANES_12G025276v8 [Manihot esculenta]|uniref:Uncharacterized protein n=1 Tax=Manihot esculenta TaxID=3983 RepID=A0ACB7GPV3_MANES|nr:hypothetical protein MANES_12G025276v8 [Manihot esculenta]